jgi:hypothetical protein
MRLTPKYANVIMPLTKSKAILGDPRAKINASRLQYVILLMRLVASDNISNKSRRFLSLNKPAIIGDHVHPVSLARLRCDIGRSLLYDIAQRHSMGMSLRNLFLYGRQTPPPPSPTHPSAAAPNAETPLPIKTAFLYVNIVY